MITPFFIEVVCLECGHIMPPSVDRVACERCQSAWLDARYDYAAVAERWSAPLRARPRSLWRYHELLPITGPDPAISLSEGDTPLIRLYHYEALYPGRTIYMKDERHQPTNSFKDRQAALAVTALKRAGVTECVLASTGNAAVAYAAYCARAGIKLWLFLTSLVPSEKMREAALYGAEVVKVSGTYDETKHVAAEFARRKGIWMDKGAKTIPGKESMKTMAFEIAEQLGLIADPEKGGWRAPDWYLQAVSGGIGPIGVWKGFEELHRMGLIDKLPKLGIIQAAGCSPMVQAFAVDAEKATPVTPQTLIHVLATGDPGYAYTILRQAAKSNGGVMLAVEDGHTFQAMRRLASRAGVSVEPATGVAFAGLEKMLAENIVQPGEVVVINCSGHTMPAESHILGDQYDKYILDLDLSAEQAQQVTPAQREGLGAALKNLDEQVTTIVVVDDNPNDRRLIRRLLQSHKQYRVYEARDGEEGLRVIQERQPDLVVCDLTMPEMDGFELLTRIKQTPEIADIPVVVVSAKSLTEQDRKILDEYSESVWQKGGFETRQLVDHVVTTLGHTPLEVIHAARSAEEQAAQLSEATHRHQVVIIEDNPSDMRLTRRILESTGRYDVIEAQTGRDGLKAIYNYHPDLVILDLTLPDLDGASILKALQGDDRLKEIPVIVISARALTIEEKNEFAMNIRQTVEKSSLNRHDFLNIIEDELR